MEIETRSMRMLIQSMPRKGFILTFVVFFTSFVACVIVGALGPVVYDTRNVTAYGCPSGVTVFNPTVCTGVDLRQNNSKWIGEIRKLDKLNQEVVLSAIIENMFFQTRGGFDQTIVMNVAIDGRDSEGESWNVLLSAHDHPRSISCSEGVKQCDSITLAHELFIKYSSYRFNVSFNGVASDTSFVGDVEFSFTFVDHQYTLFELWFRFAFLLLSFVAIILYSHKMRKYAWADWTFEQRWAAVLLFGVMGYNNPFYPLEILVSGWFPIFLNRVLYASFILLLLLYWLVLFDGIRKDSHHRDWKKFYLPKAILVGLFWISGVAVFTWSQLAELNDPVYDTSTELPGFLFFEIFMFIILVIYLFWLVYVVCRACGDMKTLPYLGVRLKFFGVFSILILLTVVGGLIFGIGLPVNSSAEFLSFLALFNLYVFVISFVYLPSSTSGNSSTNRAERIGMVRLEEDDEASLKTNDIQLAP